MTKLPPGVGRNSRPRRALSGRVHTNMEAASVPATRSAAPGQAVRGFISKYGSIVVLLAMPVWYAIEDITSDTDNLSRLGNNLVDGVSNGAIWALVAIGYTLVYGIVELINFAHGEHVAVGDVHAADGEELVLGPDQVRDALLRAAAPQQADVLQDEGEADRGDQRREFGC